MQPYITLTHHRIANNMLTSVRVTDIPVSNNRYTSNRLSKFSIPNVFIAIDTPPILVSSCHNASMERYANYKQPNLGISHERISNIMFPNLKEPNIRVPDFTLTHNLITDKSVANNQLPVLIQPYISKSNLQEPYNQVPNFTLTHNFVTDKSVANNQLPVLIQPYVSVPYKCVSNKPFTFLIEPYLSVAHFTSSFITPPCDNTSVERFSFTYSNLTLTIFLQPYYNKSNQPRSVFCSLSLSLIVSSHHNTSAHKTTYRESHVT